MVAADNWKSLDLVSCLSAYVTITFVALCAWVYFFLQCGRSYPGSL